MDQLRHRRFLRKRLRRQGEAGMSMIEVLVAGFILTVGMLGFAALMATSIAANSRSRADSTSIMLAQSLMDQLSSAATISTNTTITDCSGSGPYTVNTSTGGSLLTASDEIDWTQNAVSGYSVTYVICAATTDTTSNAQQRSYDVRWSIQQVNATDTDTYFIVVGVRPTQWTSNLKQFTLPISLKSYIGPHSTTP